MNEETEIKDLLTQSSLLKNEQYFKYIFKKTEKIVCAVFYVLHANKDIDFESTTIVTLEDTAQTALDVVLGALRIEQLQSNDALEEIIHTLVALESRIRTASAAGYIAAEHLDVFVAEIDTVIRSARSFITQRDRQPVPSPRQSRSRSESPQSSFARDSHQTQPTALGSRRDRIRAVLIAQPGASIKDISETVTDCSEKTIQRELNAMIKDNIARREGQRRWTRYWLSNNQ